MVREIKKGIYIPLGRTVMTQGIAESVCHEDIMTALGRHYHGDWGDVCNEDWRSNNRALINGTRLLSSYKDSKDQNFWIITEADRSVTTVLFPHEY